MFFYVKSWSHPTELCSFNWNSVSLWCFTLYHGVHHHHSPLFGRMCFWTFSKHLKQMHVHVCRRIYLHWILGCFSIAKWRVNIPYIDATDPSQSATLKSKYMANRPKKRSVFVKGPMFNQYIGTDGAAEPCNSSIAPLKTNMTGWRIHHFEDVMSYGKCWIFQPVMLVFREGSGVSFLHPTSSWPIHWRWRRFAKKRWLRQWV